MSGSRTTWTYDQLGRPIRSPAELYERSTKYTWLDERPVDIQQKAAVLKASPCVVAIVSLDIPAEMTKYSGGLRMMMTSEDQVFMGSGTIIECRPCGDGNFSITILTAASLFTRTNGVPPDKIKVQVYLADGQLREGNVLACDFHYNLAALEVISNCELRTATFVDLDDIMPIGQVEQLQMGHSGVSFLRPHSTLFKIWPNDMVTVLGRWPSGCLQISTGCFSMDYPELDCKELYSLNVEGETGGPAINRHGQAIGIHVADKYFLPNNVVSRWWLYYKQHRKFCRPWLGVKVANYHTANSNFLDSFVQKFPNVSSGVIVTKVIENSPAYSSNLHSQDVIVRCCGESVRSTMEFFGEIWDKAGAPVELSVLRFSTGVELKITIIVGEDTSHDNFYRWPIPPWIPRPEFDDDDSYEASEPSDAE